MKEKNHNNSKVLKVINIGQCIGCYSCMLACSTQVYNNFSLQKSAIRVKTSGGYQGRMVINICRGCMAGACIASCPSNALEARAGGGVILHREACIGCKKCISACIGRAITFDKEEKKVILCRQCGICVDSCPHHVIDMEEVQ
ncbi:Fe-S-cluster-containing dehydrogenase component [Natronincola peptidivorans]|uniref:Fe-S-cluster-containing dehydrogenase component n=1 Tax=Natronincola peptidivorans TaxID=426128 RepID=A0A1I0GH20_9FIRM|nr:4Fe-4S dicluster domain-containing protein [Natronincola peptidivorans]SET69329.1 Fe-S-cluster-containing dehydrogenase component [Natronincola peptidivorans]